MIPNQDSQRKVDIVVNLIRRKCERVCWGLGWGVMKKGYEPSGNESKDVRKKKKKKTSLRL